jgi:hypothetical protein
MKRCKVADRSALQPRLCGTAERANQPIRKPIPPTHTVTFMIERNRRNSPHPSPLSRLQQHGRSADLRNAIPLQLLLQHLPPRLQPVTSSQPLWQSRSVLPVGKVLQSSHFHFFLRVTHTPPIPGCPPVRERCPRSTPLTRHTYPQRSNENKAQRGWTMLFTDVAEAPSAHSPTSPWHSFEVVNSSSTQQALVIPADPIFRAHSRFSSSIVGARCDTHRHLC